MMPNTMFTDKIALLIPVYNDQAGLIDTLHSVNQDCAQPIEIVIVDDGSTPAITLTDFQSPHKITLLTLAKNQGIEGALNHGLEYCLVQQHSYIARIDSGDLCCGNRIALQYQFLAQNPDIALVGGAANYLDEDKKPLFVFQPELTDEHIQKAMHHNSCFCHPTVMMRASVFSKTGLYAYDYKAAEDYDLFFRISQVAKVANLTDIFVQKIMAKNSISVKKRRRQVFSRLKIQLKFFNPYLKDSYIGVIKSALMLVIPNQWIVRLKQRKQSVR